MEEKQEGLVIWFDSNIKSEDFISKIKKVKGLIDILQKEFQEFRLDLSEYISINEFDCEILKKKGLLFVCVISEESNDMEVITYFNDFLVVKNIIVFISDYKRKNELMRLSSKVGIVTDTMNLAVSLQKVLRNQLNNGKYGRRRSSCFNINNPFFSDNGSVINEKPIENKFKTFHDISSDNPKVYLESMVLTDDDNIDYYVFKERTEETAESKRVILEELFSYLNFNLNIELHQSVFKDIVITTFKDKKLFNINDNVLENFFLKEIRSSKDTKEVCYNLLILYSNSKNTLLNKVINDSLRSLDTIRIGKLKYIIIGIMQNFKKDYNNYKSFKSICKFSNIKEANKVGVDDLILSSQMVYGYSNKNYAKNLYIDRLNKNVKSSGKNNSNSCKEKNVYLKFLFDKDYDSHYYPYIVMMDNSNNNRFKIIIFPTIKFIVKKVKFNNKSNTLKIKMKSQPFYPIIKFSLQSAFQMMFDNCIREMTLEQIKNKCEKEINKLENCKKNIISHSLKDQTVLSSIIITNIAILNSLIGLSESSLSYLIQSLTHKSYFFNQESDENGYIYFLVGREYARKEDFIKSIQFLLKSLNTYLGPCLENLSIDEVNIMLCEIYDLLGYCYDKSDNYSLSLEYYDKSLEIKYKIYGSNHFFIIKTLNNIGCMFYRTLNFCKAYYYFDKAILLTQKYFKENSYENLIINNNLASIYYCLDSKDKALETCENLMKNMK
jgi:hypothetical protein